jgi:predicted helicase
LREEYEQGLKITDILPINTAGVVTGQDKNTITYSISDAQKQARSFNLPLDTIKPILYPPFDTQYIVYSKQVVTRPRSEVMRNMLEGENIALIFMRQVALHEQYTHFDVTRNLVDNRAFLSNKGIMSLSPLYIYPDLTKKSLFDTDEFEGSLGGRRPNISPAFLRDISNKLNMQFVSDGRGDLQQTFGPENIFNYMYAVFNPPTYRTRYSEFLKMDFPRLPLTSNPDLLRELCAIGNRLVELHLMERYGGHIPSYPEPGDNKVEKTEYTPLTDKPDQGRVWINKTQFFDGVPLDVWEFHIGGYQVCHKWLKDRRERQLDMHDVVHYKRIVAALAETITLMEEIDETIEMGGGWPIE